MFKDFQDANRFLQDVVDRTKTGEIQWQVNASWGGFIQLGGTNNPSFFLFDVCHYELVLRSLSEEFDIVVSQMINSGHLPLLEELYRAITDQVGCFC